jgi:PhnB protein
MPVRPIPEGYEGPIPFLAVEDAAQAIEFYKLAFGARELMSMNTPRRRGRACGARDRGDGS